ncbi:unnamed protein product [Linum trigynum]|uniref:Uncharacterized protein n=1 Tax=Linum trigynum TaxID=586398 RepID=A0AAV2D586_9ROSI
MSLLYRYLPLPVVRVVQLSHGLSFAFSAVKYIQFNQDFLASKTTTARSWLGLGLILALSALIFLVLTTGSGFDDAFGFSTSSGETRSPCRVANRIQILSSIPAVLRVTWCRIDTLFPITVVSPTTTPVAWSNRTSFPILAAG